MGMILPADLITMAYKLRTSAAGAATLNVAM
jgi:hypothetical protein